MSVSFTQQYTNPLTGKLTTVSVSVDVKSYRKDSVTSLAEPQFLLSVLAAGKDEFLYDITSIVRTALDGKKSTPPQEIAAETFLTAATIANQTVFPFNSVSGFAVGDPVVFKSKHGATDQSYALITAINTTTKNVTVTTNGSGAGISTTYPKGAVVQSLTGRDAPSPLGLGDSRGVKAQVEALSDPTVSASNGTGNSVDVNVTLPTTDAVVVSFDVYATRDPLVPSTVMPVHLEPVYQDAREASGIVNITTYTEDNNQSYSLQSGKKFYFHVVAKDAKGHPRTSNINQSKPVTKNVTLD